MTAAPRLFARSFAGGEVAPDFFGRVDDVKYQTGLAICRNFVVKPHGPVQNRAGFAFTRLVKDSTKRTRIIPFVASLSQTAIIEVGAGYFRFHTLGAAILAPAGAAWATATSYAVGDVRTNGGTKYYCREAHTSGATFAGDAVKWYAQPATGEYEIPNDFVEDDLFTIRYVQSNDIVTLTCKGKPSYELRRYGATDWRVVAIPFDPKLSPPSGVTATATPATTSPGTPTQQSYVVTAVAGVEESRSSALGALVGGSALGAFSITGATKSNPGVVTCRGTSIVPPANGTTVYIEGVAGMTQLNGKFYTVHDVTPITEDIPDPPAGQEPPRGGYYDWGWYYEGNLTP